MLDAFSRTCIGWHQSRTSDTDLAVAARAMALRQRSIAPGLIPHSDRGVQYPSHASLTRLQRGGAPISRASTGTPYEHAKAERCLRTRKTEEVWLKADQTVHEAQANVAQVIDDRYTTKRLHSRLGYRPPTELEAAVIEAADIHTCCLVRAYGCTTNPAWASRMSTAQVKTDECDAITLARLLAAGSSPAGWVPPIALRA